MSIAKPPGPIVGLLFCLVLLIGIPVWLFKDQASATHTSQSTSALVSPIHTGSIDVAEDGSTYVISDNANIAALQDQLAAVSAEREELRKAIDRANEEARRFCDQVAAEKFRMSEQIRELRLRLDAHDNTLSSSESHLVATKPTPPKRKRLWTSTNGKVVDATYAGVDEEMVLLTAKGRTYRVSLQKLIPADQAIVVQLSE